MSTDKGRCKMNENHEHLLVKVNVVGPDQIPENGGEYLCPSDMSGRAGRENLPVGDLGGAVPLHASYRELPTNSWAPRTSYCRPGRYQRRISRGGMPAVTGQRRE